MNKEKRTHYSPVCKCSNCHLGDIFEGKAVDIPLGTEIEDQRCPNCGCLTLYLA